MTCQLAGKYFYPRSPCGERRKAMPGIRHINYFYPRSPCGERQRAENHANSQQEFLSTLSLRRATIVFAGILPHNRHFYPRSPCGERRLPCVKLFNGKAYFYPRSPCGERPNQTNGRNLPRRFLSTLSLRRATNDTSKKKKRNPISIHALLAESDKISESQYTQTFYFYPRSPCGERLVVLHIVSGAGKFLSTLSLRRATAGHQ